jgi:hypothetical protein
MTLMHAFQGDARIRASALFLYRCNPCQRNNFSKMDGNVAETRALTTRADASWMKIDELTQLTLHGSFLDISAIKLLRLLVALSGSAIAPDMEFLDG